jgi:hypothetical protein
MFNSIPSVFIPISRNNKHHWGDRQGPKDVQLGQFFSFFPFPFSYFSFFCLAFCFFSFAWRDRPQGASKFQVLAWQVAAATGCCFLLRHARALNRTDARACLIGVLACSSFIAAFQDKRCGKPLLCITGGSAEFEGSLIIVYYFRVYSYVLVFTHAWSCS